MDDERRAQWVLLGGGRMLAHLAAGASRRGCAVLAVCGPAHAREHVAHGRGDGTGRAALREALEGCGASVLVTEALDAAVLADRLRPGAIGVSISAPWIFRRDVIDLFGGRLLNVHGSDLPHNRGGGGFTWQILRGDRRGGLTLHEVVPAVDEGRIVHQSTFTYPDSCRTPADFARHREPLERAFLDDVLDRVLRGEALEPRGQDASLAVYWPRLSTAVHGWIDWSWPAAEIVRFCDAFGDPYAGGGTELRGREVRIRRCDVHTGDGGHHPFQAGLVYRVHEGRAFVATRDAAVVVTDATIHGDGGPAALRPGHRLHTPVATLDRARRAWASVSARGLEIRE